MSVKSLEVEQAIILVKRSVIEIKVNIKGLDRSITFAEYLKTSYNLKQIVDEMRSFFHDSIRISVIKQTDANSLELIKVI